MRLRFSLFSIALSGILIFLLIGLYAIDRALSSSQHLEMSLDAAEAAAAVQTALAAQRGVLNGIKAVHANVGADSSRFRLAVETLVDPSNGLKRIWVADTTGRILYDYPLSSLAVSSQEKMFLDMAENGRLAEAIVRARTTGHAQLSRPVRFLSAEPELVLIQPLSSDGRFTGFIGANISRAALIRATDAASSSTSGVVITAGLDTIVQSPALKAGRFVQRRSMTVAVPGDEMWTVTVVKPSGNLGLRIALWAVGLLVLPMLIAGVLQERRAAMRVSERSAELERLSTELLRANRAKSEFLANVSHELRTPLNAIVGFVDLLRDGVYGELATRQVSPVERIAASATHLRHLVDQVLDIAKMAAGRLEVHTEPLALRPFVLDVVSEIESLVNEKGLSLSIAVGASLPKVRTDPTHLRQILMNLLGNAVKYTATGGIAVRSRLVDPKSHPGRDSAYPGIPSLEKTWIALQVADSGIGIAPGDLARIFEEFEQVDSGSRGDSVTRGTGLGLPISRRLARLLGGEISVQSEIGHGSTFTLWLPVNPVDYRSGEHRMSPEHGAAQPPSGGTA